MFNPIAYSYLRFDTVDYGPEPETAETAYRLSSSSSLYGISQNKAFVKRNAEFTYVSSFTSLLMCSTQFTLSCRIFLFSFPTTNSFFKLVHSEITSESAW